MPKIDSFESLPISMDQKIRTKERFLKAAKDHPTWFTYKEKEILEDELHQLTLHHAGL